mgnify:CR=1 FL=1
MTAGLVAASGFALSWILARWRDLTGVAVLVAALAALWAPPWHSAVASDLVLWGASAVLLGLRARMGPVRGRLLVGSLAAALAVHLSVWTAQASPLPPDAVRYGGTALLAIGAVVAFALAAARPAQEPRVRWVGEIEVEEVR